MKNTLTRAAGTTAAYGLAAGTWAVAVVTVPPALCFAAGLRLAMAPLTPGRRAS